MDQDFARTVGARYAHGTCLVAVWAPFAKQVQLLIKGGDQAMDMVKDRYGYWEKEVADMRPGTKYKFILDGELERPDPASSFQPEGVHSWSEVVDHQQYQWSDQAWQAPALEDMIIYELHVGTFTQEGTFEAIIDKLDHLAELGVNAIEIMPIAQFPGNRNWGYDGVYPFAPQNSYGGVGKLKHMVDKCHQKNIAVILDVVYNHMGPEGNYLSDFGPYFTDKYHTPWGSSLNFDDEHSDPVRSFFLQNALTWLRDFHFDGLRLDAVHAIMDNGPTHFLKELRMRVDELEEETGRKYCLIAESDMNDVKLISPYEKGGYGLDAQWVDDFHHAVHTLATGEQEGYYQDYGEIGNLAKSFRQAFIYDGVYSDYRKKKVGNSPVELDPSHFVVCIQNHDQVGNRMLGDRISTLVSFEMMKLAAGVLLIAPFVPMLFMGEEYGEDQPFQYFISHTDPELVKAVQEGRRKEFDAFKWEAEVPDPQSEDTFNRSKLRWDFDGETQKSIIYQYYKHLIRLRKEGAFKAFKNKSAKVHQHGNLLLFVAEESNSQIMAILNFDEGNHQIPSPGGSDWTKIFSSSDQRWGGSTDVGDNIKSNEQLFVPPTSLLVYEKV